MGNVWPTIKLSKYNMLVKESFTLPKMKGDHNKNIFDMQQYLVNSKFELQYHMQEDSSKHFEDLSFFFISQPLTPSHSDLEKKIIIKIAIGYFWMQRACNYLTPAYLFFSLSFFSLACYWQNSTDKLGATGG